MVPRGWGGEQLIPCSRARLVGGYSRRMRFPMLAVLVLARFALAQDPDKKEGDDRLAEAAKALTTACGAKIAVSYDWNSEAASPGKPAYQGPVYCESIIKGLTTGCSDPVAKPVIVELIQKVSCRIEVGVSKRTEGPVLTLGGTTVSAAYDWSSSNLESESYRWLMKAMPTPGPNGPVTIEARQEKLEGELRFAEAITSFQGKCATKATVTYDFASEKGNAARPAWQGFLYCKSVIDGLGMACEFDHSSATMGKKLKAVQCRFESGSSKKTDSGAVHSFKNGTLVAAYDWFSANLEGEARKWGARFK